MVIGHGTMASLLFFVPLWGPLLTLRGIAGNAPIEPGSYSIANGMVLVAMLAVVKSSPASLIRDEVTVASILPVLLFPLLASLLWFKCLKFMSQNGVQGHWQRIVMQIFVYPGSLLSILYVVSLSMTLCPIFADAYGRDVPIAYLCAISGALILSIGWLYLTRLTYRKIIQSESGKNAV